MAAPKLQTTCGTRGHFSRYTSLVVLRVTAAIYWWKHDKASGMVRLSLAPQSSYMPASRVPSVALYSLV